MPMSRTKQSVQRELKQLYINLNRLQEKITAEGGEIGASLRWLNQRDETQTSIAELEELLHTGELPDETTPGGETTGLGKLVNVPELPPHFLPRPDDLTSVKAALLGGEQPVAITAPTRKVGVQGMGGVGKSVLAAALARDAEVRRAFPDGVFWLTLGQEPALTTRQAQLAE
ncbi:MAG: hypothetical protein HYR94_24680, partial [Chloroflexi bacterium]|nr:hypothetical protein [Chloroflexota bacterium]